MFAASKSGSVSEPTDSKFNYVTMLLHGNGTNGAQNNTFVDSSTNNFTITRNGNTTQGTFTPYGSNWSNYFDGSGDYLTAPNSTAFDLSTSDFTIEGFFYPTVGSAFQSIFAYASNAGASISDYAFQLLINSSNGINFRVVASGSSSFTTISTSNTFTLNSWNYVCVTRTGTSVSIYLNGTTTTGTIASTIRNNASSILTIGRDPDGTYAITGYLSNLRILKGTAVTPSTPTTPLTAVTNTSLLTCQSNRFIDNSTNNFTITKNGDTRVQRFSPFSPTTAYSTSVIGGSGYFDGSGDRLSSPASTAIDLSTADFTIDCWVYPTSFSATKAIIVYQNGDASNTNYGYWLFVKTTGVVRFENFSGSSQVGFDSSIAMNLNTWNHIAVTRTGTSATTYVNGVGTTGTVSATFNAPTGAILNIGDNYGASFGSSNPYLGYMTDLRIVKGTRVYTANFTPPTAPLTAITNTSLLLSYTNVGILDNAMMNDLETVGNAQISTSVKKYGTGSMYFDGTGDGLQAVGTPNTAFGTGDFTVEFWINLAANLGNYVKIIEMGLTGACFTIETQSTLNTLNVTDLNTTVFLTSSSALTTGTWIHVAVTRASGTLRIFQNGTQTGSVANSTNFANSGSVYIGQSNSGQAMNGYIDDLRITKGYARYTSNFTAPTSAFPNN